MAPGRPYVHHIVFWTCSRVRRQMENFGAPGRLQLGCMLAFKLMQPRPGISVRESARALSQPVYSVKNGKRATLTLKQDEAKCDPVRTPSQPSAAYCRLSPSFLASSLFLYKNLFSSIFVGFSEMAQSLLKHDISTGIGHCWASCVRISFFQTFSEPNRTRNRSNMALSVR